MHAPTVNELKGPTLTYLKQGVTSSDAIRRRLAKDFLLPKTDPDAKLKGPMPAFINNHAWALVRLQTESLIKKVGQREYELTTKGRAYLKGQHAPDYSVPPPKIGQMPKWARILIDRANAKNRPSGARFRDEDLMKLWQDCEGRCAITKRSFSEEKFGLGRARRANAPSLDKIDPDRPYTYDNCRLVMVAINFALNSWGDDLYLEVAAAAVRAARKTKPKR